MAINLLLQDAILKSREKTVIEGLKKVVVVGFLIFIVVVLAMTGYLLDTSFRLRSSQKSEEILRAQISSLAQTEQSLFLIKDRISKIKSVFGRESANDQVATLSDFLGGVSGDVRILEIVITSQKVGISLIFPSSASFGIFYRTIIESNLYERIVLKSFNFNPSAGYWATFELTKK